VGKGDSVKRPERYKEERKDNARGGRVEDAPDAFVPMAETEKKNGGRGRFFKAKAGFI
jgi:hypothetical protein